MSSAEILEFEALLRPIPGDSPAGVSLRYEVEYDSIQEARREEDTLPMGEWQREVKSADWNSVIKLASEAISSKSKDLQIGAWLVEALIKKHGFSGLRDGLRLLRELQENFWEGLFPEVDNGDLEFRASPLQWLNEKLPPYVKLIPLTKGEQSYGWYRWEESRKVDNLGRQNPADMNAAIVEGKITGEQFDKEVDATPRAFYEELLEGINESKEQLGGLEKVLDEKFGREAPSLLAVRKALEDCYVLVSGIVKKKREQDPTYRAKTSEEIAMEANGEAPQVIDQGMAHGRGPTQGISWSGEPRSREQAFQQLTVIATYLRRSEPQHPVTYLLDRAVRWTTMPLEDWLVEVVSNEDVLRQLRETLGMKDQN